MTHVLMKVNNMQRDYDRGKFPTAIIAIIAAVIAVAVILLAVFAYLSSTNPYYGYNGYYGGMMGGFGGMMGGLGSPFGGLWFIGLIAGIVVIIGAIMLGSRPAERATWGTVIIVFSIVSFLGMGGFFIGALLGIAGCALALSWRPVRRA